MKLLLRLIVISLMSSINLMSKDVWAVDEKDRAIYSLAMIAAAGGNNVEVVKIFIGEINSVASAH